MNSEVLSRELPGPTGFRMFSTFASFLRGDLLKPFVGLFERYGPLFRMRLPLGHDLVMLAHPDAFEHVLRSPRENYRKGSMYDGARLLLGNGLVTSEGERWRRQRSLANLVFPPARLEPYLNVMAQCTLKLIASWTPQAGRVRIDVRTAMTRVTMAIVGRTLFGLDLAEQSKRASRGFGAAPAAIGRRGPAGLRVPLWVPTPGNLRLRSALRELDKTAYNIIRRFRAGQADNADETLLGAYMAARDSETSDSMSDGQLRDDVVTLYSAGHETTASLLTRALYWLGRRPEIAERVAAEIDGHIIHDSPSLDDLNTQQCTGRFVSEVLRLYPPAWTIPRNAIAEDVVLGYRIPAGAIVMLSPYLAHRWGEAWPDRLRFDPDRFTGGAVKDPYAFAYFPFCLPPRICIGMQFVLVGARFVLALILRRFRVGPSNGPVVGCVAVGTLRPDGNIRIDLVSRGQR